MDHRIFCQEKLIGSSPPNTNMILVICVKPSVGRINHFTMEPIGFPPPLSGLDPAGVVLFRVKRMESEIHRGDDKGYATELEENNECDEDLKDENADMLEGNRNFEINVGNMKKYRILN
ncbi:hypothetical protein NPIL_217651 [Nephila pilipes]|uniref:Uncharacterized protein n=1 Tax=Nephila pilipes TaxID=299642 RepID=A0A8X6T996_NEPPI|nr:hypothetical protein NPIL_217651 [Nephila pilipes]